MLGMINPMHRVFIYRDINEIILIIFCNNFKYLFAIYKSFKLIETICLFIGFLLIDIAEQLKAKLFF